jgi:hypothetical protein
LKLRAGLIVLCAVLLVQPCRLSAEAGDEKILHYTSDGLGYLGAATFLGGYVGSPLLMAEDHRGDLLVTQGVGLAALAVFIHGIDKERCGDKNDWYTLPALAVLGAANLQNLTYPWVLADNLQQSGDDARLKRTYAVAAAPWAGLALIGTAVLLWPNRPIEPERQPCKQTGWLLAPDPRHDVGLVASLQF